MSDLSSAPLQAPVLSIVLTPRHAGHAVVDGFGLAKRSFRCWWITRERAQARHLAWVARQTAHSIRVFQPGILVLGIPGRDSRLAHELRLTVRRVARSMGVPVVARPVAQARELLIGAGRGERDSLARALARGFFPELAARRRASPEHQRFRRHAWHAVALAISELARRAPLSAAAVARPEAFAMGNFGETVARRSRSLHPAYDAS